MRAVRFARDAVTAYRHWRWQKNLESAAKAMAAGRLDDAKASFLLLLEAAKKWFGPTSSRVANALGNLAEISRAQCDLPEAERLAAMALRILDEAEPNSAYMAFVLVQLADILAGQSRLSEAEQFALRSVAILEGVGPDSPEIANALQTLGEICVRAERWTEAIPLLDRALTIQERTLGTEHWAVAQLLVDVANAYRGLGEFSRAEGLFRRAIAILERLWSLHRYPGIVYALNGLAFAYEAQNRYEDAASLYERSLGLRDEMHGGDHLDVATACNNLAGVYQHLGKYEQAEQLYKRVLAISEKVEMPSERVAATYRNYAVLLDKVGRAEEATFLASTAVQLEQTRMPNDGI